MASAPEVPEGAQLCTVAAGCFWGTEHLYRRHFANKGLLDARVGYIGGDLTDPTYRAVCGGKTGRKSIPSSSLLSPPTYLVPCRKTLLRGIAMEGRVGRRRKNGTYIQSRC